MSLQAWHKSSYGNVLRFCDSGSLLRARQVWKTYLPDSHGSSTTRGRKGAAQYLQHAKDLRQNKVGNKGFVLTGLRSAAPVVQHALEDLPKLYSEYWKHGDTESHSKGANRKQLANPAFVSSLTNSTILHYGTDPLVGFHLSEAYAPINLDSNQTLSSSFGASGHKAVRIAQLQFQNWGCSFRAAAQRDYVVRFYVGEALAFCHALQLKRMDKSAKTNLYRGPNSFDVIDLDSSDYGPSGNAPLCFDVIDTSNLLDQIGAINLLVATSPLLAESLCASIHTQTIVKTQASHKAYADWLLCGDFQTVSTLLGLYPTEYWANISTISTIENAVWNGIARIVGNENQPTQLHGKISWKRSIPKHSELGEVEATPFIQYEVTPLAHILSNIYKNMFEHEKIFNPRNIFAKLDLQTIRNASAALYHRGSFAMFLRYLKERLIVDDWNNLMGLLFQLISSPTNDLHMQELWSQLHLLGVYSLPSLWDVPKLDRFHKRIGLETWSDMPEYVCVTLVVPRAKLNVFTRENPAELGTPPLQCSLTSGASSLFGGWQNIYEMIQLSFGKLSVSGDPHSNSYQVHVSEDASGWMGTSSLVVSFCAPRWTVLLEPQDAFVAFGIQNRGAYVHKFLPILGIELDVFKTRLGNSNEIFVTKTFPNKSGYPFAWRFAGFETPLLSKIHFQTSIKANISTSQERIENFVSHVQVVSEEARALLADRSTEVQTTEASTFGVTLKIGTTGLEHQLSHPAPVSLLGSKIKIARKSGYVEVIVPVTDAKSIHGIKDLMYPIFSAKSSPILWNMPRLDLNKLPVLDLAKSYDMQWLITHCSLTFSEREAQIRNSTRGATSDTRVNFKDSLFSLFMHFSGLQGKNGQQRIFGLCDPSGGIGVHTLILPSCLRLDASNGTVAIDAAIIILTAHLAEVIKDFLFTITQIGVCQIKVRENEARLWRQVLPSYVERCRTWPHHASCEYNTSAKIPLAVEHGENPLCSCGLGVFPHKFLAESRIPKGQWQAVSKYAVRAAISPSFFSPFVEEPQTGKGATGLSMRKGDGCYACGVEKAENGKALLRCGKCRTAKYCSAKCQKEDWKEHKKVCKK